MRALIRLSLGILGLGVLVPGCGDSATSPDPALVLSQAPTAAGDHQSWSTGHTLPLPLRVLVTRDGKPVGAQGVEWVADSGQGVMSPATSITGSDGIAVSRWTLGFVARQYHMRARLAGTEDTVSFTATAFPNFPHQMAIVSGDSQSQPVNTTLLEPLVVMVGDQFNNPFPGAGVEWLILSGDAAIVSATTTTDSAGLAQASVSLGTTPGAVQVKAQFPGASGGPSVIFQVTATP